MTEEPESVKRLQELLDRLEHARAELEQTADANRAVEILQDLAELAKEVQSEVERARRDLNA
jgi:flagellar biosynthesis/type III secretory pathway chaperone